MEKTISGEEKLMEYKFRKLKDLKGMEFGQFKSEIYKAIPSNEELEEITYTSFKEDNKRNMILLYELSNEFANEYIERILEAAENFMLKIYSGNNLHFRNFDHIKGTDGKEIKSSIFKFNENLNNKDAGKDPKITMDINVNKLNMVNEQGRTLKEAMLEDDDGHHIIEFLEKINSQKFLNQIIEKLFYNEKITVNNLEDYCPSFNTNFRVAFYPADISDSTRCGVHFDYGCCSLIFQKPNSGLQIWDGQKFVTSDKNYELVLGAASYHLISTCPTFHKVIEQGKKENRTSIVLFIDPKQDIIMDLIY